jgi:hypothetical protein
MKRLSISIAMLLVLLMTLSGLNSCGEKDLGCQAPDFEGEYVGKYWLLGLIPLTNNDTATITVSGNTLTMSSSILNATFPATFDPLTNQATVTDLFFDEFVIGGDTLFDISVERGVVELDNSCQDLYISLEGVTVLSGTVNLPSELGLEYPLENVNMNSKNGLKRQ